MKVTDIINLVIEKVAKKYKIKEDDVSWHKIAIELAYMYKDLNFIPKNQKNDFSVGLGNQGVEIIVPTYEELIDVSDRLFQKEKEKSSAKKEMIINDPKFSQEVINCYNTCLEYFDEHLHPKKPESWKEVIDKLNRIDKIPFEEIIRLTKLAREDDFWSKNFLSLTKLRMKDKQKIPYIVVFSEKFKEKPKTINRQTQETIKKNLENW